VSVTADWQKARKLLQELYRDFPGNGAYPFFLLPIEEKFHASEEELVELVEDAADGEEFQTYTADLARVVHDRSWQNATLSLLSQVILSTIPVPRMDLAKDSFIRLATANDLKPEIHQFALLLMKHGLESKQSYHSYEYLPIEYSTGRLMLKKGDPSVDPNSFPKFTDLPVQKDPNMPALADMESPILEMNGCEGEGEFRSWFAEMKGTF
jgi:hypothetical protein